MSVESGTPSSASTSPARLTSMRLALVWLVLVVLTCVTTWGLSKEAFAATAFTVVMILIAAFKIRLVLQQFMELRSAPLPWRVASDIWLLASTGAIVIIYLW